MQSASMMGRLRPDTLSGRLEEFDYRVLAFGHWRENGPVRSKCDVLGSFKLAILTAGRCHVTGGGRAFDAGMGDVFLFAPFVRNRVECLEGEPVGLYFLYFDLLSLEKRADFIRLFHLHGVECYPGRVGERVLPQLERVERAVAGGEPGSYYMAKLALQRTLIDLLRAEEERGRPDLSSGVGAEAQVVGRCLQYLDAHWTENPSVGDLCEALGLSQSYLCRCFSAATGYATKEFVVLYKLHLAERELGAGTASMESLAARYGFPSAQAFRAAFKKYYGTSPMAYRRENKS